MSRGYQHRVTVCPGCGHLINATSDPHDRGMPRPGDLTLCIECGTILRFSEKLVLMPVTPEELERLPRNTVEELRQQQERWYAHRGHGRIRVVGGLKQ